MKVHIMEDFSSLTIADIINRAGGVMKLANKFGYTSTQGVQYWKQRGVRRDLVPVIAKMSGVPEQIIEALNVKGSEWLKAQKKRTRRKKSR